MLTVPTEAYIVQATKSPTLCKTSVHLGRRSAHTQQAVPVIALITAEPEKVHFAGNHFNQTGLKQQGWAARAQSVASQGSQTSQTDMYSHDLGFDSEVFCDCSAESHTHGKRGDGFHKKRPTTAIQPATSNPKYERLFVAMLVSVYVLRFSTSHGVSAASCAWRQWIAAFASVVAATDR